MKVLFKKTSNRTYAVEVHRPDTESLRMSSAPGYDDYMPHDLQHFIVEQELNLKLGVFGQLAVGGTAATFFAKTSDKENQTKQKTRKNKKLKNRGKRLLQDGKEDGAISERATCVCTHNWLASSDNIQLKKRARQMEDNARSVFSLMSEKEKKLYSKGKIQQINARMNELGEQWYALKQGEHLELTW
jgi:hypothetical protein